MEQWYKNCSHRKWEIVYAVSAEKTVQEIYAGKGALEKMYLAGSINWHGIKWSIQ